MYQIRKLLDDLITRIEVKVDEENQIIAKIEALRNKLNGSEHTPQVKPLSFIVNN